MFDTLDESLKNLLIKEMPIKKNEVDVAFDQPNSEWSARISKPTLNVYLYDVQENRLLRGSEQLSQTQLPDGNIEIRRNPVRIDMNYLVTAWSKNEQDQHHLLGMVLFALLRTPFLPKDVCTKELLEQQFPVQLTVAQGDETQKWGEFWNTLNNKYHPGLTLKVTLTIDPYRPVIAPMVQTTDMSMKQTDPVNKTVVESKRYWSIGGEIVSGKYDPSALTLTWEEKNEPIELNEGRFSIRKVPTGTHHLSIRFDGRILKRHKFEVPLTEPLKIEI